MQASEHYFLLTVAVQVSQRQVTSWAVASTVLCTRVSRGRGLTGVQSSQWRHLTNDISTTWRSSSITLCQ